MNITASSSIPASKPAPPVPTAPPPKPIIKTNTPIETPDRGSRLDIKA